MCFFHVSLMPPTMPQLMLQSCLFHASRLCSESALQEARDTVGQMMSDVNNKFDNLQKAAYLAEWVSPVIRVCQVLFKFVCKDQLIMY